MKWRIKQYGDRWRVETSTENSLYWWFHGSRTSYEDAEQYLADEQRKISEKMRDIRNAAVEARKQQQTLPLKQRRRIT